MKIRLLLFLLLFSGSVFGQETLRQFALFDYNSYELTAESRELIDGMVKEIGNNHVTKIELYGHTDSDGDPEANRLLSQNRVNAVKQYLLAKGYDQNLFVTDFYGEDKPAFPNTSDEAMHKNRRVEIAFTYEPIKDVSRAQPHPVPDVVIPSVPPTTAKAESVRTITASGDTQMFVVDADHSFRITGKDGTIIDFWAAPFVDASGKGVGGEVTITLIEVYTKPEMVEHNLSTTSGKLLLESAGMVYIAAEKDGKPLTLNPGSPYTIMFPSTTAKQADMNIFYADTVKGKLTWTVADRKFFMDQTWGENEDSLNKYIFNGTELGWVNCDHFLAMKNLTDISVMCADTGTIAFCLIFKKYNSVMSPQGRTDDMKFPNVPVGETATIVGIRKNSSGIYYYSKEIVVEKHQKETAVVEKITEEEFQQRMAELK